jgi:hypothetical protein
VPPSQPPHWIKLPQPSPAGPQLTPACAQLSGTHPLEPAHWPGIPPPPQVCGGVQVPQLAMTPPQPLLAGPHSTLAGQPCGLHEVTGGVPHWPTMPAPPQVCGAVHGLQSVVSPPQPSACCPQVPLG